MSHKSALRVDKTCLNCNHVVADRFCPNCGQENTESRKTFHHLFFHFFEDLTHYENAFWKTIKNLILRPASLTKEYLSGKRLSYLAPVRLYIFISFVTFFLMPILPQNESDNFIKISESKNQKEQNIKDSIRVDSLAELKLSKEELKIEDLKKQGIIKSNEADSIKKLIKIAKKEKKHKEYDVLGIGYHSVAEMDSIRKKDPEAIDAIEYWLTKKVIPINQKYTKKEIFEKFAESAKHNFPKTLFIFMPLFAFLLWLFHNKKQWYYFDHGIFTLHYFSFLLLMTLIIGIINWLFVYIDNDIFHFLKIIINVLGYGWMIYYFFPAHQKFYEETRIKSFIKSIILFFINVVIASIILIFFIIYSFINIH